MRQTLALLFASLLLAFSLTACGREDSGSSVTDAGNNQVTDNPTTGTDADRSVDDGLMDSGVSGNSATSSAARHGNSYDQMLRNGRVYDTNGYVNDAESAVTRGSIY